MFAYCSIFLESALIYNARWPYVCMKIILFSVSLFILFRNSKIRMISYILVNNLVNFSYESTVAPDNKLFFYHK